MNKKVLTVIFSASLLITGCTNEAEKEDKEIKHEVAEDQKSNSTIKENQELTEQLKKEKGVLDGQIYEKDGIVFGTFEIDEKVSDEEAKKLATKYAEELKTVYKNLDVDVKGTKNGKEVVNIKKNNDTNSNSAEDNTVTVTVKSLIDEGTLSFKTNPLTNQISVLLDSTKFTGVLKGKKDTELVLVIDKEKFDFKSNKFKPTQFDVANTDYTEAQLSNGKLHVK